jgi:hypothetical protein
VWPNFFLFPEMQATLKRVIRESFSEGFNPFDISQLTVPKKLRSESYNVSIPEKPSNPYDHFRDSLQTMGDSMRKAMNLYDTKKESSDKRDG